jgi:dolichol-phosphate mannosyltransferase
MSDNLFIVMPAYNEADNISRTVEDWYVIIESIGGDSKMLIIDDGSTDNTFEILMELSNKYKNLIPIRKDNSGHGATCIYAYNYAIQNGADLIFQTDSDGQTNPNEFWDFWNEREKSDFIIGKRSKRQDGKDRVFVTKVLKIVVFIVFRVIVEDSNTPFRLMRVNKLREILSIIPSDFFLSNVVISTFAVKWGFRVRWIPISFKPRQGGVNSINFKRIFKIGFKAVKDFKVIKVNSKNKYL